MKIYIAFLNHHVPPFWEQLANDLHRCIPHPFEHLCLNLDLKTYYYPLRNQYHSTQVLAELLARLPTNGDKILGVTERDIFIPILTFLFGEAQLNGSAALISTYRLRNEFYGLPRDDELLYQRILKEALHELGHTLGLIHCQNFQCVMHASTYVEDSDLKEARFCGDCQKILGITCE